MLSWLSPSRLTVRSRSRSACGSPRTRSEGSVNGYEGATNLQLSLVTLGDLNRQTGGHRYHRMMERAAHVHGAEIRSFSIPALAWPLSIVPAARTVRAASDRSAGILLDSIAATPAAPWIG